MVNKTLTWSSLVTLIFLSISLSYAQTDLGNKNHDVITISSSQSKLDMRSKYTHETLRKALELSSDKFGTFEIDVKPLSMNHDTAFYELSRGNIINVAMSGATPDKDHLAIPIRIPIRRGILNYRLLVINKNHADIFKNISSATQLKNLTVGIHGSSVTAEIMKIQGFNVVAGASYDGMFRQLSQNRFDYIPRGVHEAFDELEVRKSNLDNLMIEPNLALYMPMPYYIYVSPSYPKIAERIEYGLEKMIEQKLIKSTFDKYYAEDMKKANLAERIIIDIGNPFLSPETPFERKELWIEDYAIKPQKNKLK